MSGGLTMWQMHVIFFAFGQCEHVNSSMMSDYNGIDGYLQLQYSILHCICIVFL